MATFSPSSLNKREADFKENSSKTGEFIDDVGFNNFKATINNAIKNRRVIL
jgi:hypothetical protein